MEDDSVLKIKFDLLTGFKFKAAYKTYSEIFDNVEDAEDKRDLNDGISKLHNDEISYSRYYDEIEKYRQILLRKTHRSEMEFERFMRTLQKKIHFVPMEEIKPLMPNARKISPDPNDTTYFAVALKIGASIWSNDKPLRNQNVVRIYTTKELIDLFPAA